MYDRNVNGRELNFEASGALLDASLVMRDRETDSWWSIMTSTSIGGDLDETQLVEMPLGAKVQWKNWIRDHPETTVLSLETGHVRPYGQTPYEDYATSERLAFPVPRDPRYHPKMRTLGLRMADGRARGYPSVEVRRAGGLVAESPFGKPVTIRLDPESQAFEVDAPEPIEVIDGFWFAWAAFHPDASVYVAE